MVLTTGDLCEGWSELGIKPGDGLLVHSSLSSLGDVKGGARAVVESLLRSTGPKGTVAMPGFSPRFRCAHEQVAVDHSGDDVFSMVSPTEMGAVPRALQSMSNCLRSFHPQASTLAVGRASHELVSSQPIDYALGEGSPFARMVSMEFRLLLVGVGHDKSSMLHHAESLLSNHRRKVRRFPLKMMNSFGCFRSADVGDDNGLFFPTVGPEAAAEAKAARGLVGSAECLLIPLPPYVASASRLLAECLT